MQEISKYIPEPKSLIEARDEVVRGEFGSAYSSIRIVEQLFPEQIEEIQKSNSIALEQRLLRAIRIDLVGATSRMQTYYAPTAYTRLLDTLNTHAVLYQNPNVLEMSQRIDTKIDGTYCKFDLEMQLDTAELFFVAGAITAKPEFTLLGLSLLSQITPENFETKNQIIFEQARHLEQRERERLNAKPALLRQKIWKLTRWLVPKRIRNEINTAYTDYIETNTV